MVDPPSAMTTVMAFSKAGRVMMSSGRMPAFSSSSAALHAQERVASHAAYLCNPRLSLAMRLPNAAWGGAVTRKVRAAAGAGRAWQLEHASSSSKAG